MRRSLLVALSALLAGCGYPGDPLPPALNIPERIADLRAVQRGGRILVAFTAPLMTTDQLALKSLPAVEVFAGARPEGEFNTDAWAASAQVLTREPGPSPDITLDLPTTPHEGRELVLGVRAIGPTGRRAPWSNLVTLWIVPPPAPPANLRARAVEEGVYLEWDAGPGPDGRTWRVFRKAPDAEEFTLIGTAGEPSWLDRTTSFGQRYTYSLQTLVPAGDSTAESDSGNALTIEPRDTFPPTTPAGLTVIAGVNSIELAWDRNTEADFAAYLLWRAEGDGDFVRLGDPLSALSFSDTAIVSGRRYRYALSARDNAGNDSPRSAPIEIIAP